MKIQKGSLRLRSGVYYGTYNAWVQDPKTGLKRRVQKAFRIGPSQEITKKAAWHELQKRLANDLGLRQDGRTTVKWFIENRWKPLHEGQWKSGTKDTNDLYLKNIIGRFGELAIEDSDSIELQKWLNSMTEYSESWVKHIRSFLKSIYDEAENQKYIHTNPARLLKIPVNLKVNKKTSLKLEQIQALIEKAEPRDRMLLRVLFVTGLRPSELFALRWRHFDKARKLLKVEESVYRGELRDWTKTANVNDRTLNKVYLPDEIVEELLEWRHTPRGKKRDATENKDVDIFWDKDDDFIFPSTTGTFLSKENYYARVLKGLAASAAIPKINYQIIRRSVATMLSKLGSPADVAGVLRHARIQTQAIYVQKQEISVRGVISDLFKKIESPKNA